MHDHCEVKASPIVTDQRNLVVAYKHISTYQAMNEQEEKFLATMKVKLSDFIQQVVRRRVIPAFTSTVSQEDAIEKVQIVQKESADFTINKANEILIGIKEEQKSAAASSASPKYLELLKIVVECFECTISHANEMKMISAPTRVLMRDLITLTSLCEGSCIVFFQNNPLTGKLKKISPSASPVPASSPASPPPPSPLTVPPPTFWWDVVPPDPDSDGYLPHQGNCAGYVAVWTKQIKENGCISTLPCLDEASFDAQAMAIINGKAVVESTEIKWDSYSSLDEWISDLVNKIEEAYIYHITLAQKEKTARHAILIRRIPGGAFEIIDPNFGEFSLPNAEMTKMFLRTFFRRFYTSSQLSIVLWRTGIRSKAIENIPLQRIKPMHETAQDRLFLQLRCYLYQFHYKPVDTCGLSLSMNRMDIHTTITDLAYAMSTLDLDSKQLLSPSSELHELRNFKGCFDHYLMPYLVKKLVEIVDNYLKINSRFSLLFSEVQRDIDNARNKGIEIGGSVLIRRIVEARAAKKPGFFSLPPKPILLNSYEQVLYQEFNDFLEKGKKGDLRCYKGLLFALETFREKMILGNGPVVGPGDAVDEHYHQIR